jgi:hypothetical protein
MQAGGPGNRPLNRAGTSTGKADHRGPQQH